MFCYPEHIDRQMIRQFGKLKDEVSARTGAGSVCIRGCPFSFRSQCNSSLSGGQRADAEHASRPCRRSGGTSAGSRPAQSGLDACGDDHEFQHGRKGTNSDDRPTHRI